MKKSAATLCSLSLCLWGYQTGIWGLAIPMILALELRNFIHRRWTISWEHFQFIHILGAFLWLLSIFYIPTSSPSSIPYAASYHILKCVPIGLFPLILFQTYCLNFTKQYSSIFNQSDKSNPSIDLYYPYFGICLLAASATGGNIFLFSSVIAGLAALFLGSLRSQRFSSIVFYGLIGAALMLSIISTHQFYWIKANVKPENPDLLGSLFKDLNSFSSKMSDGVAKNISNKDSLQKVSQHTKDIIDAASKRGDQANQSRQNAESSQPTPQPTQSPQNTESSQTIPQPTQSQQITATQNVAQSIDNIQSSQSSTQSPESSQSTGLPQNTAPSTQGVESAQNAASSSGGMGSSPPSNQQSGQAGNSATAPSSQGVPQFTAGTKTTPEPNALQGTSQSGGNPNAPSQPLQDGTQSPTGLNNAQSLSNIIQQGGGIVDPQKSVTQIGNTGTLQPSNAILFRVALDSEQTSLPFYIREATYNQYHLGAWDAVNSNFSAKDSSSSKGQWIFGPRTPNTASARITAVVPQGNGILKLPIGASKIEHPAINSMQVNQYGSVMVQGKPGESNYSVEFDPTQSLDSPPTQADTEVPPLEKTAVQKILNSLNLQGRSGNEIIQVVSNFFNQNFEYSLKLPKAQKDSTPLSAFLLGDRSGHCEYFASATSLLLRLAGIPTRYVVGYSVHEYSPSQKEYVVRARNAHAWVMAYVNDSWMTVDTTPGGGQLQPTNDENVENVDKTPQVNNISKSKKINLPPASVQPQNDNGMKAGEQDQTFKKIQTYLAKISNELKLQSNRLTQHLDPRVWSGAMIILGLAITLISIFFAGWVSRRYFSRRSKGLKRSASRLSRPSQVEDLAPEFYLIEKRLKEWGVERKSSETVRQWILRLKQKLPAAKMNSLNEIIDLHYRYRFDPQGIAQEDCARLNSMIKAWLTESVV